MYAYIYMLAIARSYMYIRMYVCMHIYMLAIARSYIYIRMYVCMHIYMLAIARSYMYIRVYVCMHIYMLVIARETTRQNCLTLLREPCKRIESLPHILIFLLELENLSL